jgi:uncharacterized membrane protein YfcA
MNIIVAILAFMSEYLDSALGMGYGTALAPMLLLLGYKPLQVVPAILVSQLFTDVASCIFHHNLSNVNLRVNSQDFKIAFILGLVSSIGVIISANLAFKLPSWLLTLYWVTGIECRYFDNNYQKTHPAFLLE